MVDRSFAETVVVGYDGSPGSASALDWAADDARLRRARLHVITVREPLPFVTGPLCRSTAEAGEALLHDAEQRALEVAPDLEVTHDVSEGPASLVLIDASREADSVVVGAHGMRHRTLADLGSTAWQVASHAQCPVVVVREAPPRDHHRPIVLGVDGSVASEPAISYAFGQASRRAVPLVAVHGWHLEAAQAYYVVTQSDEERRVEDRARDAEVDAWLEPWRHEFSDVPVQLVARMWHPADLLLEHAAHAQLIVVGTRGAEGFPGLLLGSVGFDLLHSAPCSLAVVPRLRSDRT
jgi:nucleotide-binding universal stress UspA family protein